MTSTTTDSQQQLELVARRVCAHGYRFRDAAYFATSGLLLYSEPLPIGELVVTEQSVLIYRSDRSWVARVTVHGGFHWTREVESIEQLEEAALEALQTSERPPTSRWNLE